MARPTLITAVGQASYPTLVSPRAMEGQKAKYGVCIVFGENADLSKLEAEIIAVAEERFGKNAAAKLKTGALRHPFRRDAAAKGYPEGSIFFTARSEQKPGVVDYAQVRLSDEDIKRLVYPGAFIRLSVQAFAYDASGNRGVSFGLRNVQYVGNGPRLDGGKAPEEEFGVVEPMNLVDPDEGDDE